MRIIVALLLASALSGCGLLQLTYNSAAMLVYRWLDGYAGFDDGQATRVRAAIDRLHEWHRASELPHYALLLDRSAHQAPAELKAAQACAILDEARSRLDALLREAVPAIVQIAADFRPEQFRHLERKFAQTNTKYWKKWIDATPAAQQRERFERAVERAERLYGPLGEAQLTVIRAQLERGSFEPAATLAETRRRQRDTVETLRLISGAGLGPEETRTAVRGWVERMQRSPDAPHRSYQEAVTREGCEAVAALHNSTTAAQRAQAANRLRGHARDLRELGV